VWSDIKDHVSGKIGRRAPCIIQTMCIRPNAFDILLSCLDTFSNPSRMVVIADVRLYLVQLENDKKEASRIVQRIAQRMSATQQLINSNSYQ
jgi:hypothetical protein